jgi:hypothetical protein
MVIKLQNNLNTSIHKKQWIKNMEFKSVFINGDYIKLLKKGK